MRSVIATQMMLMASGAPWTPLAYFPGGIRGAWYDARLGALWQDTARTIPVSATGQKVACIDDLSGNGNHATQATSAAQPTYQEDTGKGYLLFSGAQFLSAGSGSQLAPRFDDILMAAVFNYSGGTAGGGIIARSEAAGLTGRYFILESTSPALNASVDLNGSTIAQVNDSGYTSGNTYLYAAYNRTTPAWIAYRDGVPNTSTSPGSPSNSTDMNPTLRLLLGAYNDATDTGQIRYLNGRIYSTLVRFGSVNDTVRPNFQTWLLGRHP